MFDASNLRLLGGIGVGKLFRNINRGFLVTAVVILLVNIYLIGLNIYQSKSEPAIKSACESFVTADAAWRIVPDKFVGEATVTPDAELQKFADSLRSDISTYYIDNDLILDNAVSTVSDYLRVQDYRGIFMTAYENSIIKFDSITFRDNTATVHFTSRITVDFLDTSAGSAETDHVSDMAANQMILQKEDGIWKVVYAYLGSDIGGY